MLVLFRLNTTSCTVFNRTLRRNKRFSSQSTISSSSTPRDPFQSSPSLSALAEEENGGNKEQVVEHATSAQIERTLPLNHSIYTGCSAALALVLVGLLPRALVYEVMIDGEWIKLAILAAVPFLVSFVRISMLRPSLTSSLAHSSALRVLCELTERVPEADDLCRVAFSSPRMFSASSSNSSPLSAT